MHTTLAHAGPKRNTLITSHLGMALKMARKMARRLPNSVCREDLESAALLGLTEAANRYDVARREPFMGFAAKRVRGAILDHLRRNDVLTRRGRREARKLATVVKQLESVLGRAVTDTEIASAMGLTEEQFYANYAALRDVTVVQLDDLRSEPTVGASPREQNRKQHRKAVLVRALEKLSERERLVLACYYQEDLTLKEIGTILRVTESRVCQIHTQALRNLRSLLS